MHRTILIVDDEPSLLNGLARAFERAGSWKVVRASNGREAVEAYEATIPDVVLLDVDMPGLSGLQVLQILTERDADATVMMLTGHSNVEMAVEAMQLGAETFIEKPFRWQHLEAAADRAWEKSRLRKHKRLLESHDAGATALEGLGESPAMRQLAAQLALVAGGSAPVLLTGETGTGKGWVARAIHNISSRASAPFVAINCAGLSATFLDTELFGHAKGAFTDAKHAKQGLFEVANGGTIFLDEIGDLAPELQPKLLTVLETRRYRRLGETHETTVDVRLVAATHHDLSTAVRAGRFREDLYFRLAVLPMHLPPLRERGRSEIVGLASRILQDLRREHAGPTHISSAALDILAAHAWPGNIRELRNVIERAMLYAGDEEELRPAHLPAELRPQRLGPVAPDDLSLAAAQRVHILRVFRQFDGNHARTARALGVARVTLYKRLREYGAPEGESAPGRGFSV